jgi:hypothetical protein
MELYEERIKELEEKKDAVYDRELYLGLLWDLFRDDGLLDRISKARHETYNTDHPVEINQTPEARVIKVILEIFESMNHYRGDRSFWGMDELVGDKVPELQGKIDPFDMSFPDDISRAWIFVDKYTQRFHVQGNKTLRLDEICRKRMCEVIKDLEGRPKVHLEAYTLIHDVCAKVGKEFKGNLSL